MKTHAIIPIFIPHEGCPHDCVFCSQKKITAQEKAPDEAETIERIERHFAEIRKNPNLTDIEIAFYGGSFTGIPMKRQAMYLAIAKKYKDSGQITGIHLSTRPDYIDHEILDQLQYYGADVIELGVQSFDEEVLKRSNRGHDRKTIYRSSELIKERGFTLGIQLMVGLPGDSYEKCMNSVRETIRIKPDIARIYPTVVLRETALYEMYLQNRYEPLEEEEAVNTVKDMLRSLEAAGINVIRVGLKSSDNITMNGGAVGAGTYHPAFRQLAESALAREDMEELLLRELKSAAVRLSASAVSDGMGAFGGKHLYRERLMAEDCGRTGKGRRLRVTFYSAPESFSNMIGLKRGNKLYFFEKYPELNLKFAVDPALQRNKYRVAVE